MVNEPVSVAGAFLSCAYDNKKAPGVHNIGCDILNENNESLAQLGDASFSFNNEEAIEFELIDPPYPYLFSMGAPLLIELDKRIYATLQTPEQKIEVSLAIGQIVDLPNIEQLSGFAANILLVKSWPEPNTTGPITLVDGRCITSTDVEFSGGQKVQVHPCTANDPAQQFIFTDLGDGVYNIAKPGQDECLDIPIDDGLDVLQVNTFDSCHGRANQQFFFTPREGFHSISAMPVGELCFYATGVDVLLQRCF